MAWEAMAFTDFDSRIFIGPYSVVVDSFGEGYTYHRGTAESKLQHRQLFPALPPTRRDRDTARTAGVDLLF